MPLKPQSIRKGASITVNGSKAEKEEVIELSKSWTDQQLLFFKKLLQQGGSTSFNGISFRVTLKDKIVTSAGLKDTGIIVYPGLDSKY